MAENETVRNVIADLGGNLEHSDYQRLFCEFRDYIQNLYMRNPHNVRCNICAKLHAIKFPDSLDYTGIWTAFAILFGYVAQYVLDCICHELLVTCPECEPHDWIILACITVEGNAISHICNLSRRWHQSPLQRQTAEIHTVESIIGIVEDMLSKEESGESLDDRLEWMCCQADLTTYFAGAEPGSREQLKEALDHMEEQMNELRVQVNNICGPMPDEGSDM
jgi:hypothetical protein